jgi:hypothetical protein
VNAAAGRSTGRRQDGAGCFMNWGFRFGTYNEH